MADDAVKPPLGGIKSGESSAARPGCYYGRTPTGQFRKKKESAREDHSLSTLPHSYSSRCSHSGRRCRPDKFLECVQRSCCAASRARRRVHHHRETHLCRTLHAMPQRRPSSRRPHPGDACRNSEGRQHGRCGGRARPSRKEPADCPDQPSRASRRSHADAATSARQALGCGHRCHHEVDTGWSKLSAAIKISQQIKNAASRETAFLFVTRDELLVFRVLRLLPGDEIAQRGRAGR